MIHRYDTCDVTSRVILDCFPITVEKSPVIRVAQPKLPGMHPMRTRCVQSGERDPMEIGMSLEIAL